MAKNEGVSLIICCYNSSKRIGITLEQIQKIRADGINWEVVLVDNGSEDNTVEVVKATWNKKPVTDIKIVSESKPGLMNARMKGVSSSSFSILSFIDDDNWINEDWVSKVSSIMAMDPLIAVCGGSSEAAFESAPPRWFKPFSLSYAIGKQQARTGYVPRDKACLWGAGLTVRRTAWEQLFNSGFQSLLQGRTGKNLTAGEDSELCFAWVLLGWKLWYDESLKLVHFIPHSRLSLDYLARMYEGFGRAEVILSIYRNFIRGTKREKYAWWYHSGLALLNLLITGIKSIFSFGKGKTKNRILWKHNKAYSLELLSGRKKYSEARMQIIIFFQNLHIKL